MAYETIELSKEGAVAVLRFNRPESYNAINHVMAPELQEAVIDVQDDPAVRALLITGNGTAFHAGGDVKSFVIQGDAVGPYIDRMVIPFHAFITHLVRMPKPVVAAVNGVAAGAGFSIAMACDMVLAQAEALFTVAYSRIGASPDGSMTYFLVRHLGMRRAMELYLTNRVLTAAEALDWGLVTQVLPAEGFEAAALEQARTLAAGPTFAYGRAKELFYHSLNHELETQLELEARGIIAASKTRDFREGTRAFVEKRQPDYQGR
ncbi:MAG TPA: enoyl-CoA hydratase-related protein [bacterium]|nr:enoyl-CoA hydratase-related protein [bacterium]